MNEYLASLVDELYQMGMRHVVVSPGSRSTALAILCKAYDGLVLHRNLDERSAAFFALGLAKASHTPVGLICTSGSAMAHYGPALTEAYHSRIPLVALTADRPPELRDCGAPQTINQNQMYLSFFVHTEELAIPSEEIAYTYPRQVARRAYLKAVADSRPVQINIPLREPLVPAMDKDIFSLGRGMRVFQILRGEKAVSFDYTQLRDKKGLLLCGPDAMNTYQDLIVETAHRLHAPIVADPLSNMRMVSDYYLLDSYDAFLQVKSQWDLLKPDYVIQFGQIPVSKRVQQFLANFDSLYIQVDEEGEDRNPAHTTTTVLLASPKTFCQGLLEAMPVEKRSPEVTSYLEAWHYCQERARARLQEIDKEEGLVEGQIVRLLQKGLPKKSHILVANSMSIRYFDYYWEAQPNAIHLWGNRGVNGIDGTLSTALGMSVIHRPMIMVTGDLSFLHDLNGCIAGSMEDLSLTVVLFNNDGGGIFQYLPQKKHPYFTDLFATPHGLDFSAVAPLMHVDYTRIDAADDFLSILSKYIGQKGIHIIEIPTNQEASCLIHKKYTRLDG